MHAYRPAQLCIHTYTPTYLPTNIQTYIYLIHTYIHTLMQKYIHTYVHTYRQTGRQTNRRTCIAYIRIYIFTYIHMIYLFLSQKTQQEETHKHKERVLQNKMRRVAGCGSSISATGQSEYSTKQLKAQHQSS